MARYYVNKQAQANGDHEVHKEDCSFLPAVDNRLYVGDFVSCQPAVQAAKAYYAAADGCAFCSPACNLR